MVARPVIRAAAAFLALIVGCTSAIPTVEPSVPAPSPSAGRGQPITFQVSAIPNFAIVPRTGPIEFAAWQRLVRMVHSGVYRHDATLAAVPDLAAEPCDVADDLVTITCTMRDATFHDNSPVTARDVAYMFELARSEACPFFPACLAGRLHAVEPVNDRTVRFTLAEPYAPFLSSVLAEILIQPRAQIEATYEEFSAQAREVSPARADAAIQGIRAGLQAAEPDCETGLAEAERVLADMGVTVAVRDHFPARNADLFDPCAYAPYLVQMLRGAASSVRSTGTESVAAAYPVLAFNEFDPLPIGAGAWKLSDDLEPTSGVTLVAHDGHHHGAPKTHEIRVRVLRTIDETRAALLDGSLDWLPQELPGEAESLRDIPGLQFADYPTFGYGALQFNVREGRLFADRNLRQAVALCIDKERIVEASVDGAVAIDSPIPPGSWAYQPGLARPRDIDAARALIEGSGWSEGSDGVYVRDGIRLSAEIVHRADVPPVVAQVDRIGLQVRDCGIELTSRPVHFGTEVITLIDEYPHYIPGTSQVFDTYFGGWSMSYDPDVSELFHSRTMTSETQAGPGFANFVGFSDERVDALLDEGLRTYDRQRRTEIYREVQRILAEEVPFIFMAAIPWRERLDADLTSTAADLDLDSPHWWWQLETLVNPAE